MATPNSLPHTDIDPFSPEALADPLPMQEHLRELGPVFYLSRYEVYGVARYSEVHQALTNWQSLRSGAGVGLSNFTKEKPWRPPSLLLEADPPRHDAPRAVLEKLLSQRQLKALQEQWREDADDVVAELLSRGLNFDAVTELAEVFPLRVFPDAVGLRQEGREHLLPYGDFAFNAFGPHNALLEKRSQGIAPSVAWVGEQCLRENLAEVGFGADIWAAADRGEITPEQAPLIVRSLLTAGVDTTVTGIASLLHAVAGKPEQWERLRSERDLLPRAFEEAVRLESPVQTFFRTTSRQIEIDGVKIGANEKVLMFLGAANHDPRRWANPDEFDISRDPSGHVGFGMGIHQCVGQHVARLEATAVLNALLDRVESFELDAPPKRHLNNTLRGWQSIPVRVSVA